MYDVNITILGICKQFFDNLVNDVRKHTMLWNCANFSDLEIVT